MDRMCLDITTHTSYSFGRFVLLEQPSSRQRKSGKAESRYLHPNPMIICPRETGPGEVLPRILDGMVSVQLVSKEGYELNSSKGDLLASATGGFAQRLDEFHSARFSLKVLESSESSVFRLCFTIVYLVEGVGNCEEKVLSRQFTVYSAKQTPSKQSPITIGIKPSEGFAQEHTEVWIKGKNFSEQVVVTFGNKLGKIIETSSNLIIVAAPQRDDLSETTKVDVEISNNYDHELLICPTSLVFTYKVQ